MPTPRISTGSTPEGSVIVSISMPHAGGETEKLSLRTIPSVSTRTETDFGRDLERLADDLRAYDQTRGLENQELGDNIQALRDELRDLAAFLTRSPPRPPSPPSILSVASEPYQPPRIQLRDSPVPRPVVVSETPPTELRAPTPRVASPRIIEISPPQAASLSRSTSNASSVESYLSSHHSDDDILEEEEEWTITHSLQVQDDDDDVESILPGGEPPSSPTSSSTFSSSPESSPSTMSSSESTARPVTPPDVEDRTLFDIKNKLDVLEDGQRTARDLLERLGDREFPMPEDHTPELADRMQRIEDILRDLVDQGHPRGAPLVFDVPPSVRPESMGSTSSSLGRLASILRNIASDEKRPQVHVPFASREGPSMVE